MGLSRRFIQYRIRGKVDLQTDESWIDWTLISPEAAFETVDLPFWERIGNRISENERAGNVRSTIAGYDPQEMSEWTKAAERRKFALVNPEVFDSLVLQRYEVAWGKSLAGRQLLLNETMSAWNQYFRESKNEKEQLMRTLQKLYLQGFFDWNSAVGLCRKDRVGFLHSGKNYGQPAYFCRRCGYGELNSQRTLWQRCKDLFELNESLIEVVCASCGREDCLYCPQCLRLGIAKSCEPYLDWSSIEPYLEGDQGNKLGRTLGMEVPFHWNGALSPAQQEASDQLVQVITATEQKEMTMPKSEVSPPKEFLVWAVCGAGKTEILFRVIHRSLQQSKKILITSPRRDVILELTPRLKEVFPRSRIRVLHGESDEKYEAGDLFLTTTHQTLRFQNFFDLVVVDEEDAFPYHFDKMLAYVVQRAKKKEGKMVYLTATPTDEMIQRAQNKEIGHVLIPERFHGHPLAVPDVQPVGKWRRLMENEVVMTELVQFIIHLLKHKRYGYVFVPHVSDLQVVQTYMRDVLLPYIRASVSAREIERDALDDWSIESVHASHPQRTDIVQRFRDHEINVLITTTILERGVTIPYSDVAVVGSDAPVFNMAALIQMAGRVGRKAEDPVGNVWLFPEVRTKTQVACIRMIRQWNETAEEFKEEKRYEHNVH